MMRFSILVLLLISIVFFSFRVPTKFSNPQSSKVSRYENIDTFLNSAKIVVIDYWYAGCGPCKRSIPMMNQIAEKYTSKGIKVYGLNPMDDLSTITNYKTNNAIFYDMFPISIDLARAHFISEYPTVVIYKKNKVAMTLEGFSELTQKQLSEVLDKLLKN